jgi:hypothetical protein
LLTTFGVTKHAVPITPSPKSRFVQSAIAGNREPTTAPPIGEYMRKRRALAAIRRLAGSGMPLQPFAYTLFDLVNDAVPHDEASPGLTAASGESSRWIIRDFDYSRWSSEMHRYLLVADSHVSGFRPPSLLPQNPRTVLRHEEIVLPNYYRSEGYNEFFRWMGMHHGLLTLLRDEQSNFLGYYPIFRSEKMKPFSRHDIKFLEAAAGTIAQGIRSAGMTNYRPADDDVFEPFAQVPKGMVVMDRDGKVLSINRAARSLFHQFAIYDGRGTGFSINRGLFGGVWPYRAAASNHIWTPGRDLHRGTTTNRQNILASFWRDSAAARLCQRFERTRRPFHGTDRAGRNRESFAAATKRPVPSQPATSRVANAAATRR